MAITLNGPGAELNVRRHQIEYTITPSVNEDFIEVKVKGDINRHSAMQMNLEAHEIGRRLRIRRYLVDATEARNTDDAIETYNFSYSDMQRMECIDKGARVAMLVSPDDHSHDFVATTLFNAGLSGQLFTDPEKAMQFLFDDDTPR
jgi:hypothetical protein